MAVGFPAKTNFATGDVLTAAQMNDVTGTLNLLNPAAKGVIFAASAANTPAAVTVGTDGQVLTADAASSQGVKWATVGGSSNTFYAGKNKIINGDFFVNQRALSSTTSAGYGFDRWAQAFSTGTSTYSAQTFTPGTAPVSGYEGATYARILTATQSGVGAYSLLKQPIESVRTLAGQTATVSFWAKAATGTPKIAVEFAQNFGSGGSPSAEVDTYAGQVTLSTSWVRYSVSVTVPSISGKTIGTTANTSDLTVALWVSAGTNFNARTGSIGVQNNTFDIWGVQVEAGSTATDFQTASGSIGGELALCQRYYWRNTLPTATTVGTSLARSSTVSDFIAQFPVTMRLNPSAIEFSGTWSLTDPGVAAYTVTTFTFVHASLQTGYFRPTTASGLSQGKVYTLDGPTSGYIGFSAEL